ncbi:hypothetical protein B0J13DRAFT_77491 [Dactylonectria estremocensis]|uniref:Uncharacterized protein n=1 Tax=Dactylonectria estremocensis TaxID=1079267 RepID=A0A9P9EGC0_9HYPO|nr:hypothetical protein B0J13DRAFT_77491 [Dactylonectria estremocensis]
MLLSSSPEYADVSEAERVLSIVSAGQLKRFLFADRTTWYYSPTENSKNPRLDKIIQGLGRHGMELPNSYWAVLERYNLVRTAEQEQQRCFLSVEIAPVPYSSFAEEVSRLVRGCLQATTLTRDMTVQFVRAGRLSLHTFHDAGQQLLKIHEKWLSKEDSIQELGLPKNLEESDVLFHITKHLLSDVLGGVPKRQFNSDKNHSSTWLRKRIQNCAEQRLLYHMRIKNGFSLTPSPHTARLLTLAWDRGLSWGDDCSVTIQLHVESTCFHLRDHATARDFCGTTMACMAGTSNLRTL